MRSLLLCASVAVLVTAIGCWEAVPYIDADQEKTRTVWTDEQHKQIQSSIEDGKLQQPDRSSEWFRQHCQTDVPLVDVCKWGALNFTQHNDAYRALQCHQNPPDCSSVKYLVVFQTHYKIGFGWTSYFESLVLAFALKHNRVLIEGAEMPECPEKYNWRWCPEGSRSHSCYFSSWSSCTPHLKFEQENAPWVSVADIASGKASRDAPVWYTIQSEFFTYQDIVHKATGPGFFWFMSLTTNALYNPLTWMRESVSAFTSRTGLDADSGFIVAHIRWGGKASEQPLLPIRAYFAPLKALSSCLGTNQVLIQTETQDAADALVAWCLQNNMHCVYTPNPRPGNDNWSPELSGGAIPPAVLLEGGYVASLNYAIGSFGRAFIGTMHSSWSKLQVGGMIHNAAVKGREPPIVINLAEPYAAQNAYTGPEVKFLHPHNVPFSQWKCPLEN